MSINNEMTQIVFLLLLCVRQLAAEIWFIGRIAVQLYMCTQCTVCCTAAESKLFGKQEYALCAAAYVLWSRLQLVGATIITVGAGQRSGSDWRAEL